MRPCLGKIWRRQNNHFFFFCIEFEKVGLHPNLNFRYTFLYWAKAGIIILTKWNIELCIICITVELHTKFSLNVTERKKICVKQHWAQYWALWYTTFQFRHAGLYILFFKNYKFDWKRLSRFPFIRVWSDRNSAYSKAVFSWHVPNLVAIRQAFSTHEGRYEMAHILQTEFWN